MKTTRIKVFVVTYINDIFVEENIQGCRGREVVHLLLCWFYGSIFIQFLQKILKLRRRKRWSEENNMDCSKI